MCGVMVAQQIPNLLAGVRFLSMAPKNERRINMYYKDRLLPTQTYDQAVAEMKEKHLMAITCPSCGKSTPNSSSTCWICNESIEFVAQVELYQCPKSNKCVMDCHHRIPHKKDKFCSDDEACPTCVRELASDITFFPEDFEIE